MFLLRCFFAYVLFIFSLSADDLDSVLASYYQSLLDICSFYYEIDIKTEDNYGKKILNDDLTLDKFLDSDFITEVPSSKIPDELDQIDNLANLDTKNHNVKDEIVIYKEIKEDNYSIVAKILKNDTHITNKIDNTSQNKNITLSMFKVIGNNSLYQPFMVNNYDLNYIDYFIIYRDNYNFNVIKTTSANYFYRGVLKPDIKNQKSNLFDEIQIKFSKKYNLITKMVLKNKVNKVAINIEVASVEKIRNDYVASKFLIYDDGKKTTIDLHNIQLSIPIDIENNYKITLDEYIKLTNEENN